MTTPWDVQETGILKVQEKRKNLEISLVDTDTVWLNQSEEGASLIKVRVNEDGMIPPRDIMEQMTVTCTCGDERLEMEALERNDAEPEFGHFGPISERRMIIISLKTQCSVSLLQGHMLLGTPRLPGWSFVSRWLQTRKNYWSCRRWIKL